MNNINIKRIAQQTADLTLNSQSTVLVTGANGFLSGHIIEQLLLLGYSVRGTVRDANDKSKIAHFYESLPVDQHSRLSFVSADLEKSDGWAEAVEGCKYVLHVASPFRYDSKIEEELVQPAVLGTRYVLEACVNAKSPIDKVIVTSSGKAIFEGNTKQVHFNESHWLATNNAGFYGKSKYYAEKEAWRIYEENKDKLNLTVINPTLILGPTSSPKLSASLTVVVNLLSGAIAPPPITIGIVDVRDVAAAHILCIQDSLRATTKGKRYIICSQTMWIKDIAKILANHYTAKTHIQTQELTSEEFGIKAETNPFFKETLRQQGQYFVMDNTRSIQELGMQYINIHQIVIDSAEDVLKHQQNQKVHV